MQSILINKTNFFFSYEKKIIDFTLPNDWTPLDNAKKQINQATAKATAKLVTIPSGFSIPLLIWSTRRLKSSKNIFIETTIKQKWYY